MQSKIVQLLLDKAGKRVKRVKEEKKFMMSTASTTNPTSAA
jgi:hypothetical protein